MPMLFTDRFLKLLAVMSLPALFALHSPAAARLVPALTAALFLLAGADYVRARIVRAQVQLERVPVISLSAGTPQALKLRIANLSRRAARLTVREVWPPTVEARRQVASLTVPARSTATLTAIITPTRRGRVELGDVYLRLAGPLGLVQTQWRARLRQEATVMPNLAAIIELERVFTFGARQARSVRRSDYMAEGFEFESLRDYVEGDDSRHIDWKSTAKRHKVMSRQYEIERSQRVVLALDCGRLMSAPVDGASRLDLAVNAAVLLSYVASRRDDYVGVLAFAGEVLRFLPPKKGAAHFRQIVKSVADLEPQGVESDYSLAFSYLRARIRRRSLIVVITDLVDPDASSVLIEHLVHLHPRHLPLCVSIRDQELERAASELPERATDVYSGMVARSLMHDARQAMALLQSRGCLARETSPRELSSALVQAYLSVKKRRLL